MLLHFKNVTIDDDIFDGMRYVRDLDLFSFRLMDGLCDAPVHLNLIFNSPQDARRAFFTIASNELNEEVDIRDIEVEWPASLMDRIMNNLLNKDFYQGKPEPKSNSK